MMDDLKANVLIVDDKPQNLISLEAVLEAPYIKIIKANSGNEALSKILEYEFALILLDVQMPDMDGFETAEYIRGNKKTKNTPIIFVTAINKDQQHVFKGYASGAVDYIFKPLDPDIIRNKVQVFLDIFNQRKIIEQKNEELQIANKQIIAQQKAVIEEERLKVLLQMAGAAAHELNQPLMVLLGNIEMLELVKDDHEKVFELIPKIQDAGKKISNTVKKIQNVRYDVTVGHDSKTQIIKLDKEIRILAVEDSKSYFNLLKIYCQKTGNIALYQAVTIKDALFQLGQDEFDIVLVDYNLPDGTGLELMARLRTENIDIPVIAITGAGDEQIASSFLKAGAFDYLSKEDIDRKQLFAVIKDSLERFGLKKEMNRSIEIMAENSTRDELTGLHNRRYMKGVLEREIERARRYGTDLCCLMLDLDFFKKINDTYGHLCGDFVLQSFSKQLREEKRQSDYIFRYGGEEFLILTPQTKIEGALQLAEIIRKQCQNENFVYDGHDLNITVSIGISSLNMNAIGTPAMLIEMADKALYEAKTFGRNCTKIFLPEK